MILRITMIRAYGSACNCCGEKNGFFLNIDHINGRSTINERRCYKEWQRLMDLGWPKEDHQLLCWNCNFAKKAYGQCPHRW